MVAALRTPFRCSLVHRRRRKLRALRRMQDSTHLYANRELRIANCKSELSTVDSALSKSFMAVGCCVSQVHRETYGIASVYLIKIAHKFIRKKEEEGNQTNIGVCQSAKLKIVFRWLCAHSGYRHHVACACSAYVCRARPHTLIAPSRA